MLPKLQAAGTGPSTTKPTIRTSKALPLGTFLGGWVVLLKRVFAETFKIIGTVGGNEVKLFAWAFSSLTEYFLLCYMHIVMLLKPMVAETLRLRTHHLAVSSFTIPP